MSAASKACQQQSRSRDLNIKNKKKLTLSSEAGYHVYCVSPALTRVPEGDWVCQACAAQPLQQLQQAVKKRRRRSTEAEMLFGGAVAGEMEEEEEAEEEEAEGEELVQLFGEGLSRLR